MSILWQSLPSAAFRAGVYAPDVTVAEVMAHGDFGVGEYESLDGELTVLEGQYFRQTAGGKLLPVGPEERLCFASVTHFQPQARAELPGGLTNVTIQPVLAKMVGTPNAFYALRIDGTFEAVTSTAFARQSPPYQPSSTLPEVTFNFSNVEGTLVVFYSPKYAQTTGVAGFHFHFLDTARTGGGHVTSFTLKEGCVQWQRLQQFALRTPTTESFDHAILT